MSEIMQTPIPESAINVIGQAVYEADTSLMAFNATHYNEWEYQLYHSALKNSGKKAWIFKRFGADDENVKDQLQRLKKAVHRDAYHAMSLACKSAFESLGRKRGAQIRKGKCALIYFDVWGETAVYEGASSWRDSMYLDMIPKSILKDYGICEFSCKVRGERSSFFQGMSTASDLLNTGLADTVFLCGMFRSIPALVLSEAAQEKPQHWPVLKKMLGGNSYSIERTGCFILSKAEPDEGVIVHLSDYFALPEKERACEVLSGKLQAHVKADSIIYGALHPAHPVEALERQSIGMLPVSPRYYPICSVYGDSACMNGMVALSHFQSLPSEGDKHALLSADDGQGNVWLLQSWMKKTENKEMAESAA